MIGVGKAFASPPSEPCWRFSRTRLSSRWFPHRGCLARYQTVDCVNSKKLREGGYSPPLTPLPAPTPCVSSAKRLRLAIVQVWLAHRLASLPRMALRHCRNYLASCQTFRIQLPTFLPIGAVLLAAPLTAQKRHRCYEGSDSRPLTPYGGSLRLLCLVFRTSNPQPRYGPECRFRSRLNALGGSCDPGFAMNEQARRTTPPKQVRHPAGCSFASSCSPPRIAATQSPSATCATTSHRTDFHPPDKTASQTHSFPRKRESRAPARAAKSGCPLSRA